MENSVIPAIRKTRSRAGSALCILVALLTALTGAAATAQGVLTDDDSRSGLRRASGADQTKLPGDKVFQRSSDVEWRERNGSESPQFNEELEIAPQPFYERFSGYIRQTTGRRVQGTLPFSRVGLINQKLPESYVVSNGDQIEIQIWGTVNVNYNLLVDPSGRIFVPEIGSIQVQGVRNSDLTATLTAQFKRVYKGFEMRALVSAARSVDVTITGQAQTIGQRSIPSSVSVIGAALSFTRPAEGGSRRFIELRRAGRVQKIDLYCFSHGNCGALPTALQDGDNLHIPVRTALVAIGGAVNRPGIFELTANEGYADLLVYAGGLAIDSSLGMVDLYSFQEGAERGRTYRSIGLGEWCSNASATGACRKVFNGDFIEVRPALAMVKGSVTVSAAGVEPVKIRYEPGMRLLDAVKQPLTRFLSTDIVAGINRGDFKSINEIDERLPELDLESVTIYRLNADSRGYDSISADALAALKGGDSSASNVPLNDGDVIALDTKSTWRSPRASMNMSVRIYGEVRRPGRYRYAGIRNLKDVIAEAGGVTGAAAVWSAVVLRNDDARASLNRQTGVSVLRSVFAHQARQEAANATGSVSLETARSLNNANVANVPLPPTSALNQLIGSRTVVYVDSVDTSKLTLNPGDIVLIPPVQETIGCYGAVFRQGELALPTESIAAKDGRQRCGIVDEMAPSIYQFSVRDGMVCRDSWLTSCPDMMGGDFLVAVPDTIKRRGAAAFMDFIDGFYRTALSAATLKYLIN